jgi:hypothetical protein
MVVYNDYERRGNNCLWNILGYYSKTSAENVEIYQKKCPTNEWFWGRNSNLRPP